MKYIAITQEDYEVSAEELRKGIQQRWYAVLQTGDSSISEEKAAALSLAMLEQQTAAKEWAAASARSARANRNVWKSPAKAYAYERALRKTQEAMERLRTSIDSLKKAEREMWG